LGQLDNAICAVNSPYKKRFFRVFIPLARRR
jgi:hypothetical protein